MKIGEKIRRLRIQNSLTQEELAERTELTKGFISQLERSISFYCDLVDILEGLGTNLQEFLIKTVEEKIVFSKDDAFETENEN